MRKNKRYRADTRVARRRSRSLGALLAGRPIHLLSLEEGLAICNELFPMIDEPKLATWDFELARFPYGWVFNVTNDWHKWMDMKLESRFGVYPKPEQAIVAFLEYVLMNGISVRALTHKS